MLTPALAGAGRAGRPNARQTARLLLKKEQIQGPENTPIARFQGLCCYQIRSENSDGFRGWCGSESRFAHWLQAGFEYRRRFGADGRRWARAVADFGNRPARLGRKTEKSAHKPQKREGIRETRPPIPRFCHGFRSEFKAPKTPPSHGLTGFAAIKSGAKSADIQRVNSSQTGLRRLGGMRQPICDQTMNGQSAAQATPDSLQKQEQIKGPENASIARFDGLCCYQTRSGKMSRNLPSAGSLSAAAPDARACWRNWA